MSNEHCMPVELLTEEKSQQIISHGYDDLV